MLTGVTPHIESSPIQGKPADALVEEAKRLGADLIVVGNRRVQGIGRVLGSVATDVAHHAPCDVYIVKTT
jgi:nucleotide-binding universal stress UspA family protein